MSYIHNTSAIAELSLCHNYCYKTLIVPLILSVYLEDSTSASGSESVELNNSLQSDCCSASDDSLQRFVNSFHAPKLFDLTKKWAAKTSRAPAEFFKKVSTILKTCISALVHITTFIQKNTSET